MPDNKFVNTPADVDSLAHIKDTYVTATAINPNRYPEEHQMLVGFPKGVPIIVRYFHNRISKFDTKTYVADLSAYEDSVHVSTTAIENFEMQLITPIEPSIDTDDNTVSIQGEAITYPGFVPYVGDIFFYEIDNGTIGIFKINLAEPTSFREGKYHKVTFNLIEYLNSTNYKLYTDKIYETLYFDRNKFLASGELTFFTSESYVNLQKLRTYKREIIQYYMNMFYDKNLESIVRPDGVYDPYIVKFFQSKFSFDFFKKRPKQLYSRLLNFDRSIWYQILSVFDKTNFDELECKYYVKIHSSYAAHTDHNALLERRYLLLGDLALEDKFYKGFEKENPPYFPSMNFYTDNIGSLDLPERTLYKMLKENDIIISDVMYLLDTFKKLEPMSKFYWLPVYLDFIDLAIKKIT